MNRIFDENQLAHLTEDWSNLLIKKFMWIFFYHQHLKKKKKKNRRSKTAGFIDMILEVEGGWRCGCEKVTVVDDERHAWRRIRLFFVLPKYDSKLRFIANPRRKIISLPNFLIMTAWCIIPVYDWYNRLLYGLNARLGRWRITTEMKNITCSDAYGLPCRFCSYIVNEFHCVIFFPKALITIPESFLKQILPISINDEKPYRMTLAFILLANTGLTHFSVCCTINIRWQRIQSSFLLILYTWLKICPYEGWRHSYF